MFWTLRVLEWLSYWCGSPCTFMWVIIAYSGNVVQSIDFNRWSYYEAKTCLWNKLWLVSIFLATWWDLSWSLLRMIWDSQSQCTMDKQCFVFAMLNWCDLLVRCFVVESDNASLNWSIWVENVSASFLNNWCDLISF